MESEGQSDFSRRRWDMVKICFKVFVFCVIGFLMFYIIQCIFQPKRFTYLKLYDAGKLTGYYVEEKNSIDVIICGTSHSSKAILPMELYEKYGIKSYNLSTSIQPIEATYYLLCEALKTQKPKVFVYDVSGLYKETPEKVYWLYVLNEMRFGKNKIELAKEYQKNVDNCDESMKELLIPLLRHHTRWNELKSQDFTAVFRDKSYFGKGGQINSVVSKSELSVEQMNLIENELLADTEKQEYVYDGNEAHEEKEEDALYDISIAEKNIEWLKKLKALCEENGICFLAVKVPTIYWPQQYQSAWTIEKYNAVKLLCNEYDVTYYDMLYDFDVDINWESDTSDKGMHINLLGAQKVSAYLGGYLKEKYNLPEERDGHWDKDLLSYQKVRRMVKLQTERNFETYINMLANEYKDNVILMSVADDMTEGLKDEIDKLKILGLKADYSNAFQKSYIAVIENGRVTYETLSNRRLSYREKSCDKPDVYYELRSSGWRTVPDVSIMVSDNEFAYNQGGLNVVVYDDERNLVIDSVCFAPDKNGGYMALRDSSMINNLEIEFEKYIIEKEKR